MKISMVATILNEENTIEDFMKSVLKQTIKPDEFVVVDGGSSDSTLEILKKYSNKHKWIKVFQVNGATIGRGRNFAIGKSKNEIIACTDAGCVLDKRWLRNITKPFERKGVDVSVGIYKSLYKNDFEYFQGLLAVPKMGKIDMPSRMSTRSLAFKKDAWKNVGGFPDLVTGEDTSFHLNLKKAGYRYEFVKDAIVHWRMRKNWKAFAKQFYKYGVGDRKSGNIFRMKTNFLVLLGFWFLILVIIYSAFTNFIILVALLGISFLYFLGKGVEIFMRTKKTSALFYATTLFFLKRICYFLGVSIGKYF
jgi:glycosyltransferase involved in cell wall biosynthesis